MEDENITEYTTISCESKIKEVFDICKELKGSTSSSQMLSDWFYEYLQNSDILFKERFFNECKKRKITLKVPDNFRVEISFINSIVEQSVGEAMKEYENRK